MANWKKMVAVIGATACLAGCGRKFVVPSVTPEQVILGAQCVVAVQGLAKDAQVAVELCQQLGRLVSRATDITITQEQAGAANACIGESVQLAAATRDRIASCEKLAKGLVKSIKKPEAK